METRLLAILFFAATLVTQISKKSIFRKEERHVFSPFSKWEERKEFEIPYSSSQMSVSFVYDEKRGMRNCNLRGVEVDKFLFIKLCQWQVNRESSSIFHKVIYFYIQSISLLFYSSKAQNNIFVLLTQQFVYNKKKIFSAILLHL